MEKDKQTRIERLKKLANDKDHIRKYALRTAGLYLGGAKDRIVEAEICQLDDEIQEDQGLYDAYEALIEVMAKEVVRIGGELEQQAKEKQKND